MADLVGDAAEEDETFWNHETWQEGSDDDEFSEEEIKPDVFDSDFNDTEDESDSDDDSEEEGTKKAERKAKSKATSASNKYKEPGSANVKPKAKNVSTGEKDTTATPAKRQRPQLQRASSSASITSTDSPRSLRVTTKEKSDFAESERKRLKAESDTKRLARPAQVVVRQEFTQKELLLEALETEEKNLQWLSGQRFIDDGRSEEKAVKKTRTDGCIRKLSRRGTYDSITFTDADAMPSIFSLGTPDPPAKMRCAITGAPAKYLDPLTGCHYASVEAFKALRARHKMSVTAR